MKVIKAGESWSVQKRWNEVVFSLDVARRAVPYVARVIADIVESYQAIQACRRQLALERSPSSRATLVKRRDAAMRRLNDAMDECEAVGAHLLDLCDGVVAFRCEIAGRPLSLLWRLGDSTTSPWNELDD